MSFTRARRTMSRSTLLALAVLGTLAVGNAGASDPAESPSPQTVIETRQAGFKKMGAAMKAIVEQLKSDAPDNARMAAAAQVISSGAETQLRWFPAGSGAEAGVETDALPHIWKDRAKFDSIANQLIPAAKTLATAMSGNDLAAIRAQVKIVADTCATCHRSFRAD
jgi:cytochrome c556